jgi:hypothetical protein
MEQNKTWKKGKEEVAREQDETQGEKT